MKPQLLCLILLTGCATARDELLPTLGATLNKVHTAQAAAVEAREAVKTVSELFCREPRPETAPVCAQAERALLVSREALDISADALDAASEVYTEVNEAVK